MGRSSEMLGEEGLGALVGLTSGLLAAPLAHLGREAVILAGIVPEGDARLAVEPLVHRLLLVGRDEMIGTGDVQGERPGDRMFLTEQAGNADRIITDAGVDVGARRSHVSEPAAEAVADCADLAGFRQAV